MTWAIFHNIWTLPLRELAAQIAGLQDQAERGGKAQIAAGLAAILVEISKELERRA